MTIALAGGELMLSNWASVDASSLPGGITVSGSQSSRIFEIRPGANVALDSITFRDGAAPDGGYPTNYGGGILNYGRLILDNCTLQGNQATQGNEPGGGGIENDGGTLVISNCLFTGNFVGSSNNNSYGGGGILNDSGILFMNDSTFTGNFATNGFGGGLENYESSATLSNVIFAYNLSGYGGGGLENYDSPAILNNVLFNGNSSSYGGGGFSNDYNSSATFNNVMFSGNSSSDDGGGLENYESSAFLNNVTLTDNSSSYGGGGLENYESSAVLSNVMFAGDSSSYSAGGFDNNYDSHAVLNNVTFTGNSSTNGDGGGIFNDGELAMNNCTLTANSAVNNGGGIFNDDNLTLTNTILAGNTAGTSSNLYNDIYASYSGANNLTNGDPLLAPLGNYGGSIQTMPPLAGSPAINSGDDSVTNFLATDQRGYPRLSGTRVDIGAVELQNVPAGNPPLLMNPTLQANGALMFQFTSIPGAEFNVLASTNVTFPLSKWTDLGTIFTPAAQSLPGQYEFTDLDATNYPQRFYRVVSP